MYAEGLPGDPPPEMVDGKLKVPGSGLYTVTALSSYNNTGGQIRIVRNHESVIIAIGPTSGFGSGSNTTPVQLELEADELVWLQVTKNTSLIRNLTSCSLELSPVAA